MFWQAAMDKGLIFLLASLHLNELVEETVYCPFRCLLHRLSLAERWHHEEIGILDLVFNVHLAVRK